MGVPSFVQRDGRVVEHQFREVLEAIGPEYAADLVLRGTVGQPDPASDVVRADIVREREGALLRVVVGECFLAGPDQRLVDWTGLAAHGDMARLVLAAMRGALSRYWRDPGVERIRLEAGGRLAVILQPALAEPVSNGRAVIGERAIEPGQPGS